jgi:hypothetical protein
MLAAACGGGSEVMPRLATSPGSIGVGEQRVLIALLDQETGEMVTGPGVEVTATLRDRIGSPLGEYEADFVWVAEDVRGMYAFDFDFPGPGTFQVTLEASGYGTLGPLGIDAVADPIVVAPGDTAPRSVTRTVSNTPLDDLTSDPSPDPAMYQLTVADAIDSGPAVIVFATPAWCISDTCGPLLDQVKALRSGYPGIGFVHVEVYEDIHVTNRDDLVTVPAVDEWGLPSEPWVFVVDRNGLVTASFEGVATDEELADAFDEVAS